jgi:hypothetical protein
MKAYGNVEVQLHWLLNYATSLKGAIGFKTCSWHFGEKKISLAPASNQTMTPQSIQPQRSRCNAYTIMALDDLKNLKYQKNLFKLHT